MSPDDPRHGTTAGYAQHYKDDERPCRACYLAAQRMRKRNRYLAFVGEPATVPALGLVRRIQALEALGWPLTAVARESGVPEKTLRNPFHRGESVTRATFDAVAAAYERMCMTVPPQTGYYKRAADRARRLGYAAPLAWDNIDDPDEQPQVTPRDPHQIDEAVVELLVAGTRIPSTRAEKEAAMARWLASGRSEAALCSIHGWRPGRYVVRHEEAS